MLVQDWTAFFRLGCINLSGLTLVSFHYDFSYGIVHMDLHSSFDKINYFLFQFFSQILLILHSKHFFGWKPVILKIWNSITGFEIQCILDYVATNNCILNK